jgi:hypothetical protein
MAPAEQVPTDHRFLRDLSRPCAIGPVREHGGCIRNARRLCRSIQISRLSECDEDGARAVAQTNHAQRAVVLSRAAPRRAAVQQ